MTSGSYIANLNMIDHGGIVAILAFQALSLLSSMVNLFNKQMASFRKKVQMSIHLLYRSLGQTAVGPTEGTLTVRDNRTKRVYEIPIKRNAINALEFRKITSAQKGADPVDQVTSGLRLYDPGYMNTACTESNITFIDGKEGYIQYRGYSIEHIFENHDYEDAIYLLNMGKLPSPFEKKEFRVKLAAACIPPQHVVDVIQSFPRDALTNTMIFAGMAAYASHDEGTVMTLTSGRPAYYGQPKAVEEGIIRSLSALATVIAVIYCHKRNRQFTMPDPSGSFIGNVLLMMGFTDAKTGGPDEKIMKCFEKLWILYADHEMTNSTSAFMHAASTLSDPLSCCISGLVSAYGPLHGGAIDLAYKGFEDIGVPENVPLLIGDVKAKKQRLFGYGHRIYKAVDPRSKFIRQMIHEYSEDVKRNPLLQVAMEIDRVANEDPYFTSRNLKANADLYGCFLYTALGFETDIIIAMASLSRTPGVLAHWREAMLEKPINLWRPQQIFTGSMAKKVN